MAYVLPTFVVMGFGYCVAETALGAPAAVQALGLGRLLARRRRRRLMAALTVFAGRASVLYTFYPPLIASPFFYIGLVLVVVGSWIWCS